MEDPPLWEGGVIRTRNEKLTACCIRLAFSNLPDNLFDSTISMTGCWHRSRTILETRSMTESTNTLHPHSPIEGKCNEFCSFFFS